MPCKATLKSSVLRLFLAKISWVRSILYPAFLLFSFNRVPSQWILLRVVVCSCIVFEVELKYSLSGHSPTIQCPPAQSSPPLWYAPFYPRPILACTSPIVGRVDQAGVRTQAPTLLSNILYFDLSFCVRTQTGEADYSESEHWL